MVICLSSWSEIVLAATIAAAALARIGETTQLSPAH
jgi:hypothetical protein